MDFIGKICMYLMHQDLPMYFKIVIQIVKFCKSFVNVSIFAADFRIFYR